MEIEHLRYRRQSGNTHSPGCHPDDARRVIDAGVDGIYCSNHGGRQANGGVAAIDVLPGIVEACGRTPVLFDSGVRSGSDVAKALAMGQLLSELDVRRCMVSPWLEPRE
jgi:thiazole synthase ThiGH ThiG subunit